jgi:hypothetical protein
MLLINVGNNITFVSPNINYWRTEMVIDVYDQEHVMTENFYVRWNNNRWEIYNGEYEYVNSD